MLRLIWITDPETGDPARTLSRLDALEALPMDVRRHAAVQVRAPRLSGAEHLRLAQQIVARARRVGAQVIVNDRVDIAMAVTADGLHLGRHSMAVSDARRVGFTGFITMSAHSVEEVTVKASAGASIVLLSPIFASPGKGTPLGLTALADARERLAQAASGAHLVALGGIDLTSAEFCLQHGADGVAVVRADLTSGLLQLLSRGAPLVATDRAPH